MTGNGKGLENDGTVIFDRMPRESLLEKVTGSRIKWGNEPHKDLGEEHSKEGHSKSKGLKLEGAVEQQGGQSDWHAWEMARVMGEDTAEETKGQII